MVTQQEALAYFAGILDGEGNVEVHYRHHNTIGTRLTISNTSLEVMNWLLGNFDGTVYARRSENSSRKTIYNWRISGEKARDLLKLVLPYLVIKVEQAKLVLRFWELREKWGVTPRSRKNEGFVVAAEPLLYAMKVLNKVGEPDISVG